MINALHFTSLSLLLSILLRSLTFLIQLDSTSSPSAQLKGVLQQKEVLTGISVKTLST